MYDDQSRLAAWLFFNIYDDGYDAETFDAPGLLENNMQYFENVDNVNWLDSFSVAGMTADGVYFTNYSSEQFETVEYTAYHPGTGFTFWCSASQLLGADYDYLSDVEQMLFNAYSVDYPETETADITENYRPGQYSDDPEKQAAYEQAYLEQAACVEEDITNYLKQQVPESSPGTKVAESFRGEDIEEAYQQMGELDPGLYRAISDSAAYNLGSGPLTSHIIHSGVDVFFSDSEIGQELRQSTWEGLGQLAGLFIDWSLSDSEQYTDPDSMLPVAANDSYALVRSYGTLRSMLDYLEEISGYKNVVTAVDGLSNIIRDPDTHLKEINFLMTVGENDPEELERISLKQSAEEGRIQVLKKYKSDYALLVYRYKLNLLYALGVKNPELLVEFPDDFAPNLLTAGCSHEDLETMLADSCNGSLSSYYYDHYGEEKWQEADDVDLSDYVYPDSYELLNKYVYMITDAQGYAYAAFLFYSVLNCLIGDDGTCSLWARHDFVSDDIPGDLHVIMDRSGNILYMNNMLFSSSDDGAEILDGSVLYYDITPSGNVLRQSYLDNFSHGFHSTLEWVSQDGNATQIVEGTDLSVRAVAQEDPYRNASSYASDNSGLVYSDTYEISWTSLNDHENHTAILDMKTGKLLTDDEKSGSQQESPWAALLEKEEFQNLSVIKTVNDRYVLLSNNHLYDSSGKDAANLEDGDGVQSICYADGLYRIVSNTGWYYILNEDFEWILEPVKIGDKSYCLTGYGLLVFENDPDGGDHVDLYDQTETAVLTIYGVQLSELNCFIIGNENAGWYNLRTGTKMLIQQPQILNDLIA